MGQGMQRLIRVLGGGGNPYHKGAGPGGGQFASGGNGGKGKPESWTEVNVKKGDKITFFGRDGEAILLTKVVDADPYKRFHQVKIVKLLSPFPKDKILAENWLDRAQGGVFRMTDIDFKYTNFARGK